MGGLVDLGHGRWALPISPYTEQATHGGPRIDFSRPVAYNLDMDLKHYVFAAITVWAVFYVIYVAWCYPDVVSLRQDFLLTAAVLIVGLWGATLAAVVLMHLAENLGLLGSWG